MLRVQVAAFPGTPYRRLKAELEALRTTHLPEGVNVRFVQSRNDYAANIGEHELREIEANVQQGYVHIAVLPTRDFGMLQAFTLDCRRIRLQSIPTFRDLSAQQVYEMLNAALDFERKWCESIRPVDWHSPLLLPPPTFEVDRSLAAYWQQCDCYGEATRLANARSLLQRVEARHRRSQAGEGIYWIDEGSRRFRADKSRHGMTVEERSGKRMYRFAFEVPVGFHYDVTHSKGGGFRIGSSAQFPEVCARANVNPWGRVVVKE